MHIYFLIDRVIYWSALVVKNLANVAVAFVSSRHSVTQEIYHNRNCISINPICGYETQM